jgi:hypothetical protein
VARLEDPDEDVGVEALRGLAARGGERANPPLLVELDGPKGRASPAAPEHGPRTWARPGPRVATVALMASWSPAPPPRPHAGRAQLVLALLGALSIVPPYLGPAIGLELDVPADVEVVDHVVPGVAIVLGAAAAALLARRGEEGSLLSMALTGWCFLGGLWQTATHFPLVLEGGEAQAPWAAVALHSTAGPVIAVFALWLTLRPGGQTADYA